MTRILSFFLGSCGRGPKINWPDNSLGTDDRRLLHQKVASLSDAIDKRIRDTQQMLKMAAKACPVLAEMIADPKFLFNYLDSDQIEHRKVAFHVLDAFAVEVDWDSHLSLFMKLAFSASDSETQSSAMYLLAMFCRSHIGTCDSQNEMAREIIVRLGKFAFDESKSTVLRIDAYKCCLSASKNVDLLLVSFSDITSLDSVNWGFLELLKGGEVERAEKLWLQGNMKGEK